MQLDELEAKAATLTEAHRRFREQVATFGRHALICVADVDRARRLAEGLVAQFAIDTYTIAVTPVEVEHAFRHFDIILAGPKLAEVCHEHLLNGHRDAIIIEIGDDSVDRVVKRVAAAQTSE